MSGTFLHDDWRYKNTMGPTLIYQNMRFRISTEIGF